MELIRLENITKTYHLGEIDVPVLKGISLTIQRGELVALMGASGSGKTTLMNILGCLDRPSSGNYALDGTEISTLAKDERALVRTAKLGFVFQSFNLLPRTNAALNVLMPLDYAMKRPSRHESRALAERLLKRVGLGERLDHEPSQMSGGQQQRVAIARSLVNSPALVLADEPTGNLDSHTSVEILEMFQQLNAQGITVILVTHDPKVAAFASRVIRIADGLVEGDETRPAMNASHSLSMPYGLPVPMPAVNGDGNGHENGALLGLASAGGGTALATVPLATVPLPTSQRLSSTATEPVLAEVVPEDHHHHASPFAATAVLPPTLRTALSALYRNKMRSLLTALGVIIGVTAVIAITEIGNGSKKNVEKTVASMGANNLVVLPGAAASGGVSFGSGSVQTLTPDDCDEIVRQCPDVSGVAPIVRARAQIVYQNRNWNPSTLQGTSPSFLAVRDWEAMDEGDIFTDNDVRNGAKVCVVGTTIKRELFQNESPIGKDIRIQNVSFRVIGVLSPKGANMMGMDQDDIVLAPWTTIKYRVSGGGAGSATATTPAATSSTSATSTAVNTLNNTYPNSTALYPAASTTEQADTPQPIRFTTIDQIMVKAISTLRIPMAMDEITQLLRERHRIRTGMENDFNLRDNTEMVKNLSSISSVMSVTLLIVAFISLVVGGVGIMNIMLVSVTERTREIGLRMAVGARGHHILKQFLVEATVLCVAGGAIGIALGRLASLFVRYVWPRWPTQPSLTVVLISVLVSAGVGIIFGFYPALKASRLDPIEALRYE